MHTKVFVAVINILHVNVTRVSFGSFALACVSSTVVLVWRPPIHGLEESAIYMAVMAPEVLWMKWHPTHQLASVWLCDGSHCIRMKTRTWRKFSSWSRENRSEEQPNVADIVCAIIDTWTWLLFYQTTLSTENKGAQRNIIHSSINSNSSSTTPEK